MPQFFPRRPIRLTPDVYQHPGVFLITICIQERTQLFGRCAQGRMGRSGIGEIVRQHLLAISTHWTQLELDAWVIMPDHLHFILRIRAPFPVGLPQAIGGFKSGVAREVGRRFPAVGTPLWQRRFHDRVLPTDAALVAAREYIRLNPARWR